jgi:DNA-binding GntR family transcriptional regulator
MSRQDHLFQVTVNKLILVIQEQYQAGDVMPNDSEMARQLDVSRSTVRKTLEFLEDQKILARNGSKKTVIVIPDESLLFDIAKLEGPKEEKVERYFIESIRSGQIKPGDRFSELELARQSECNTVTVREFLIRFSRFGLIEKKPRSQWHMKTFDEQFVDDLYELRYLFEMNALAKFMSLPPSSDAWKDLQELLDDHKELQGEIESRFEEFAELDKRFHTLLQQARPNQFISQFYDIISFIFHYHYQWDKNDEQVRNGVAVNEHIEIIRSILTKDIAGATLNLEKHLQTAKRSLKNTALLTD